MYTHVDMYTHMLHIYMSVGLCICIHTHNIYMLCMRAHA